MILYTVPSQMVAGDTWRFIRDLSDYPAPTWTVTYYFENQVKQFSQAAVASGTMQSVTISSTTTADIPPGRYRWFARGVSAGITETVKDENGWFDVLPDIGATGTHDHRSDARKMLDAVNATLIGKATDDQLAMAINGRSISRIPLPELTLWRAQLRSEVNAEEKASAAVAGRYYKVRLTRG